MIRTKVHCHSEDQALEWIEKFESSIHNTEDLSKYVHIYVDPLDDADVIISICSEYEIPEILLKSFNYPAKEGITDDVYIEVDSDACDFRYNKYRDMNEIKSKIAATKRELLSYIARTSEPFAGSDHVISLVNEMEETIEKKVRLEMDIHKTIADSLEDDSDEDEDCSFLKTITGVNRYAGNKD